MQPPVVVYHPATGRIRTTGCARATADDRNRLIHSCGFSGRSIESDSSLAAAEAGSLPQEG